MTEAPMTAADALRAIEEYSAQLLEAFEQFCRESDETAVSAHATPDRSA